MRHALLALVPYSVLLAACAGTGQPADGSAAPQPLRAQAADAGGECNNDVLAEYVGKAPTPELLEQARARSGARHVRVGQPGMAMTMDFRQDRLTVFVGENGLIETISCG